MSDTQTSLVELLEEETRRSRQVRARLESIALAGEVLRAMLGRGNLADAVQTLLAGVIDAQPCRRVLLFEVGGDGMREIGRAGDGADEPVAVEPLRIPIAEDSLAWQCVRRGRHLLVDSVPLPEGGDARGGAWLFPFEGRLGDVVDGGGRASHLLWIDRPDVSVPEGTTLDFLLSLTGQAGVLLTGFRYRDDLQRTYEELRVANNHLQRDIDRARRIQEALLPRELPRRPGLMAASRYLPAAKVGGDYFDCFPADPADPEGVQTLVIADVSGHGISAAMVMAMFKVLLRREAQRSSSPAGILERLNSVLRDNIHGLHYVTVFLAFHDPHRRRLVYATAGHCPPLLIRGGAVIEELRGDGLFLGVFDTTGAVEKLLELQVGDDLLLYTDGITEAENPAGEFFGLDRLKEAVSGGGDPDALLGRLLETWRGFASGATLQDDVTLLAIGL